jgi:hypothetical protein
VGTPAGTAALSVSTSSALFGASAVDFGRCLMGAADAACLSGARISVQAVTGGAATIPGPPRSLVTSSSGSSVTLTWSAPASGDGTTGYVIEAGSAPGLANLANVVTGSTATTFSAGGVGNGTYYVRVRAQNAAGTSDASNESALVVGSNTCTSAPGAPGGLTITSSGSTVLLAWNAPAGGCAPTSYVLQAGSSAGASDLANSNVGSTTSYVATGVGNGTYYVRVRAANAYGQSASSNEVVVTVGTSPGQNFGTYQLQSVRGSSLPVPLFGQCSIGGAPPCAPCSESATWGTLTLRTNPNQYTVTLIAGGVCVDPLGASPTTPHSYTTGATGSWSDNGGGTISFATNALNLSAGIVSGSTISVSFNWLNPTSGGPSAAVTAVFGK